jgi:hypothetical protein
MGFPSVERFTFCFFAEGPAGVCRAQGPPQKTHRLRQRPRGFDNLLSGSGGGGRLCRAALSSGAFWGYLSCLAAVETAGEKLRRPLRTADPSGPRCEWTESLNLGFPYILLLLLVASGIARTFVEKAPGCDLDEVESKKKAIVLTALRF